MTFKHDLMLSDTLILSISQLQT